MGERNLYLLVEDTCVYYKKPIITIIIIIIIIIIMSVLPKGRSSTASTGTKAAFCRRQVFHHKLANQGSSFTRD